MSSKDKVMLENASYVPKFNADLPEDLLKLVSKSWGELIDLVINTDRKDDPSDYLLTLWDQEPTNVFLKGLVSSNEVGDLTERSPREQVLRYILLVQFCTKHELVWWKEDPFTQLRADLIRLATDSNTAWHRSKAISALEALK